MDTIIDFESKRDSRYRLQHRVYATDAARRRAMTQLAKRGHSNFTTYMDTRGYGLQFNFLQADPQAIWNGYEVKPNPYGLEVTIEGDDWLSKWDFRDELARIACLVGIPVEAVWQGANNDAPGKLILVTHTHDMVVETFHTLLREAEEARAGLI